MKALFLILLLLSLITGCQDYGPLIKIQHLSPIMSEVSGISKLPNEDLIWMINDSGNKNSVYGYRPTGKIEREITVTNAINVDWEDLASDTNGHLYIGDFGNNKNERRDLKIYTIEYHKNTSSKAEAKITSFYYSDQKKFPPKRKNWIYNTEALIKYNNAFYVFTKNTTNVSKGTTTLYKIPARPGHFKAEKLANFRLCKDDCFVTAATFNKDKSKLVLLSSSKIFIFSNFKKDHFFSGDFKTIDLKHKSQKEAVTFKNDSVLYITDERRGSTGGNLYEYRLNSL